MHGRLQPGAVLEGPVARYRIVEKRGEGGFGVAWRGVNEADGRAVLVKELRVERLSSWKSLDLFEREARVLRTLGHEGIPRYQDFFAWDGKAALAPAALREGADPGALSLVLVQDFVEGRSLAEAVAAGQRFSVADVERVMRALLDVLAYLHALQPPVVHRDINPRNVIVQSDGQCRLVDFGAIQDGLRFGEKLGSTNVGSFGYMPLEHLGGRAVPATDLFALAMTMLATLSHRAPTDFPHDDATGKVKLDEVAPGLPPRLRAALDGMCEPIVGRRLGSARAVLDVLDGKEGAGAGAGVGVGAGAGAAPVARKASLVYTVPLVAGLVGGALLYTVLHSSFSESQEVQATFLWFLPAAFGVSGKFFERRGRAGGDVFGKALAGAVVLTLALLAFFVGVFPNL